MGRIWRSTLSVESKAVLTAIRYHGNEAGVCTCTIDRIEAISSLSRSTVLRRIGELVDSGWLVKVGRGVYTVVEGVSVTPSKVSEGHHEGVSVTPCQRDTVSGRHLEGVSVTPSPTPPNKEIQTSPDDDERARRATAPILATDAIGEKLAGHPGKEALTPFAEVAVSVLGVCPEVYTLESWLMARYSVDRVEYGLRQAKQAALGQFMPLGKIIISAGRWMQRAQPEEYRKRPQAAHGGAETVQPIPAPQSAAKPPITAAEADAMLAEVLR